MRDRILHSATANSSANITGVHGYVSPWRKWALILFLSTAVTSIIFSSLALSAYSAFSSLVSDVAALGDKNADPLGVPISAWTSLFNGVAASAVFAVILTVVNIILSSLLLCCARKSVAHPHRTLSKSFLVASCWFAMLHTANITSHFHSFQPLMRIVSNEVPVSFNNRLLMATVALGLLDTLLYLAFGLVLVPWVERPDLLQLDMAPSPARV